MRKENIQQPTKKSNSLCATQEQRNTTVHELSGMDLTELSHFDASNTDGGKIVGRLSPPYTYQWPNLSLSII